MRPGQRNPRALLRLGGNRMSALRLDEFAEETVCVRIQRCRKRRGTCLHRPAELMRAVRHRQGALALNGCRVNGVPMQPQIGARLLLALSKAVAVSSLGAVHLVLAWPACAALESGVYQTVPGAT